MIDAAAPVEVFDEIDSTNSEARRRAERGAAAPVWLIARRQSAGRGRRGRPWLSLEGNLFATFFFRTTRAPSEIALLGFAAGLAIAEALEAFGAREVALKWPNDVMISGAKTAGILIDSGACARDENWAALGFGVNVSVAPKAIDQPATSLREALGHESAAPTAQEFFTALRPRIEAWAGVLAHDGFAPIRQAWLGRVHGLGRTARVVQGPDSLEGRIAGLSARGELELDTESGRRLIAAGDVFLTSAA